jgi:hypothetical protein
MVLDCGPNVVVFVLCKELYMQLMHHMLDPISSVITPHTIIPCVDVLVESHGAFGRRTDRQATRTGRMSTASDGVPTDS